MYDFTSENYYSRFFSKSKEACLTYSYEDTVFFSDHSLTDTSRLGENPDKPQLSLTLSGFTPLHAEEGFKLSYASKQEVGGNCFDFISPFFPINRLDLELMARKPEQIKEQARNDYLTYVTGIANLLTTLSDYTSIDVTCISLGGKILTDLFAVLRQRDDSQSTHLLSIFNNITLINSPLSNDSLRLNEQEQHIERMPNIGLDDPRFIGIYPSDPVQRKALLKYLYSFIYADNLVLYTSDQAHYPIQTKLTYISTSVDEELEIMPDVDSIIDIKRVLSRKNGDYHLAELVPTIPISIFPMPARGVGIEGHFINTRSKKKFKEMLARIAGNNSFK